MVLHLNTFIGDYGDECCDRFDERCCNVSTVLHNCLGLLMKLFARKTKAKVWKHIAQLQIHVFQIPFTCSLFAVIGHLLFQFYKIIQA